MHTLISIGIGILIGICLTVIAIVVIADTGARERDCIRTDTKKCVK